MSSATRAEEPRLAAAAPPPALREGDRLDQPTFHARYEATPGVRAELIGGVVSMPSPVGIEHSDAERAIHAWLDRYEESTPGVHVLGNATVILGWRDEYQPDAVLRVRPGFGGRTRDEGDFVRGSPELVVEVSRSSRYIDLGPKLEEYERAGVLEYVVRALGPDEVRWHVLRDGRYAVVPPGEDGLYRSAAFPGLWLDASALLRGDRAGVREALGRGLATAEHAAFVGRLAAAAAAAAPPA